MLRMVAVPVLVLTVLVYFCFQSRSGSRMEVTPSLPGQHEPALELDHQAFRRHLTSPQDLASRKQVRASRGSAVDTRGGPAVYGKVRDSEGLPISGATIRLYQGADGEELQLRCESDSAGGYRLAGATTGKAVLYCFGSGWDSVRRTVELEGDGGDSHEDFVLHRPAGVPLRITTDTGGNPFAGARRTWRVRITGGKLPAEVDSTDDYEPRAGTFTKFVPSREARDHVPVEGVVSLKGATGYVHVTLGSAVIASRFVHRSAEDLVIVLPDGVLNRYFASLSVRYIWAQGEEWKPISASLGYEGVGGQKKGLGPDATFCAEELPPGRYTLRLSMSERTLLLRTFILRPGQALDLGEVRSLAVEGQVTGPDGMAGAYSVLRLGRFLPDLGVVDWSADAWTKADSSGRFGFSALSPGRYLVRCDRNEDLLSVANFPSWASEGIWVDLKDRDQSSVEVRLHPTVQVVVPARTTSSRTRSLRIHDESGYELLSEWVRDESYSLYLVAGTYEVAWWSDQEELERRQFVVGENRIELAACP